MSVLGNPDQIEALAARLERDAAHLDDIGNDLVRRLDQAWWRCAKADRYRNEMRARRADAGRRAEDFRAIAADLRRHAQSVRQTMTRINGLERNIRNWMRQAAANPNAKPPWEQWGIRIRLPASGDPAWLDLQRTLARFGVRF